MTRKESVRFDVLRNGVKITELKTDLMPTIQMDGMTSIKTSLSGSFANNDVVNWLTDEIQPVCIIDEKESPCGVFLPATVRFDSVNSVNSVSVEAYDRCWRVQTTLADRTLHFPAGAKYLDVVKSLLSEAGIALVVAVDSSAVLRTDREDWSLGTDFLTIINALLDEINYNELWFDENGYAVLEPEKTLSSENIARSFNYYESESFMLDQVSMELDLFNAPNVFTVICANPDDNQPMVATAINNNPSSPLSTVRRGRRIAQCYTVDNIPSQAALNEYAQLVCQEHMLIGEKISLTTAMLPGCGINQIVSLVHPDAEGICIETGWTMQLGSGGTMTHKLEKVVGLSG